MSQKLPKRIAGHALSTFTSTIKNAGAHVTTGRCKCGWHNESTYGREVRSAYQGHLAEVARKQAA